MSTAQQPMVGAGRSGLLGVYWFLGSEATLFGALIVAAAFFRLGAAGWSDTARHLSLHTATLATVCLLGATLGFPGKVEVGFRRWRRMLLVSIGGSLFLVLKAGDFVQHWNAGFRPDAGLFWAAFYLLTGLHGLHVLAGVILAGWFGWLEFRRAPQLPLSWLRGLRLYWYFVDTVWFCLLGLFYAG